MKKLLSVLSLILITLALVFVQRNNIALAEEVEVDEIISSQVVVSEDLTYIDKYISLVNTEDEEICFVVKNGATLILDGCTLDGNVGNTGEDASYTFVFSVEKGGKLILKGTNFVNVNYSDACIDNYGSIDVDAVTFISGKYSIINNSDMDKEDNGVSIYLRNGSLERVLLNSGFISVGKDTIVTGTTKIAFADASIGALAVKGIGNNVFASKYIDNFQYTKTSDTMFLDYIGDHDSSMPILDATETYTLQSGDIILSGTTADFVDDYSNSSVSKLNFSATNCTLDHFLKINKFMFRKLPNELNNYTAITSSIAGQYTRVSGAKGKVVSATINLIDEDGASLGSSFEAVFNAGINHAIFVDIPEDYTFKTTECYIDGVVNTSVINVSSDLYSNGTYMRPILEYVYTEDETEVFNNYDVTINFIFSELPKSANVSVSADSNINVVYPDNMISGNTYTFNISDTENVKVTDVYFNGKLVELLETDGGYYFTEEVAEENTIEVNSVIRIVISPNPTKTIFEYGETISLTESYYCEISEQNILITYTPNANTDLGTYEITSATCNSQQHEVVLAEGTFTYTIIAKKILIEPNPTKTVFEYGETIILTEEYYCDVLKENIIITYTQNASTNPGTYEITSATCNSSLHEVVLIGEKVHYTIKAIQIEIEPSPAKTVFEYGETIVLTEEYYCDVMEDQIIITYIPNESTNPGTYEITSATCNSSLHEVVLVGEKVYYTINAIQVEIAPNPSKTEFEYGETVVLTEEYYCEVSNTTIIITYGPNSSTLPGTYDITSATSNSMLHEIVLTQGKYTYSIKPIKINIVPTLTKTTFSYGETIVLAEEYYCSITNKKVLITYKINDCKDAGTYKITEAVCDSSMHEVVVLGDVSYTITPISVDVSDYIKNTNVSVEYSSDFEVDKSLFLKELPEYLSATLVLDGFDLGLEPQDLSIQFALNSKNHAFMNNISIASVTLTILPSELNTSGCEFKDLSIPYSNENKEIFVTGYDPTEVDINYTYYLVVGTKETEVDIAKNCGTYKVKAEFISLHDLFTTNRIMYAQLTITKVDIVLDDYVESIAKYSFTYDGNAHGADLKRNTLPSEVQIDYTENERSFVNAGTYITTIHFKYDSENYNCINSCTSVVEIAPKQVTISLVKTSFNYSGVAPSLSAVASGLVSNESCDVILSTNIQVDYGSHKVDVVGLSNPNYTFTPNLQLTYSIKKINVDFNQITFKGDTCTYDGNAHVPTLTGVLPTGITYVIDNNVPCKNVGTYNVKCTFINNNINYNTPEPIYATVVIKQRPVYVEFEQPGNMIANGVAKRIIVTFSGVVEGETLKYDENYSDEPVLAGEYTLTIVLPVNSNYYIANSQVYQFSVFTNTLSIRADGVNVKFEGKFTDSECVDVAKVNNEYVSGALDDKDVKNYTTLNFTYTSYTTEPIKVSVKSSDVVSDTMYLRVYRVVGESLEEVEYSLDGNLIVFNLSSNGDIVFAEGYTMTHTYRFVIVTIYALAFLFGIGYIVFFVRYRRLCNPYLQLMSKKK